MPDDAVHMPWAARRNNNTLKWFAVMKYLVALSHLHFGELVSIAAVVLIPIAIAWMIIT